MKAMRDRARQGSAWWAIAGAVGALLLAIVVLGVVAIVQNERVLSVTSRALAYDLEVEDEGDDIRVAVLDLRHFHRNIAFGGPSAQAVTDFDQGYATLLHELDELEALGVTGAGISSAAELRAMARDYYDGFRAAIPLFERDPAAFRVASDAGLRAIEEMDDAASRIDGLGEQLTEASIHRVAEASGNERVVLVGMVGGAVLAGIALAVSTARTVAGLRAAWGREQEAARAVARALRSKTDFVADASHELRTPLTVIRGNAQVGLAAPGEPIHKDVLTEIEAEATRMGKLVDDLLFLARSDAGAPPMEREFMPARLLLGRVARPAETLVRQRGARFVADLRAEGYLEADPGRIEQAILNLIDNAAKHAPPDSTVTLRAGSEGGALVVSVADEGPGIPPAELPLIFERFYQVGARRSRRTHGAGLGLPIARSIVEAHGGVLEAGSVPGQGTTMTIRLPLCAALAEQPAPDPTPAPAASPLRRLAARAGLSGGQ
jgi:two-component system, OmpR family, sensor histidine kinase VicK